MTVRHRVYLIPGFFGFTQLGDPEARQVSYFHKAGERLREGLAARGLEADVEIMASLPTASLPARAKDVLHKMEQSASKDDADLHLIGHSTGGLDARGIASLKRAADAPPFLERVRTVVTMATPHFGTPLASFFHKDRRGDLLLQYLGIFTFLVLRQELRPVTALALQLLSLANKLGNLPGGEKSPVDEFIPIFRELSPAEVRQLEQFCGEIRKDRALIEQLMPETLKRFNSETRDDPSVRYGSVVTGAPRPMLKGLLRTVTDKMLLGLWRLRQPQVLDPESMLFSSIFRFLYEKTAPDSQELQTPEPTQAQRTILEAGLGRDFRDRSDGIVPTRSQAWGQIIDAMEADHLDVTGHFDEPEEYVSWLKSGSHFNSERYTLIWERVLDFMVGPRAPPNHDRYGILGQQPAMG